MVFVFFLTFPLTALWLFSKQKKSKHLPELMKTAFPNIGLAFISVFTVIRDGFIRICFPSYILGNLENL